MTRVHFAASQAPPLWPAQVPDWMLNRKKDVKDGKFSQAVSNTLDMKLRDDLERMKKIRAHRGLRHYCAPRAPPSACSPGSPGSRFWTCVPPVLSSLAYTEWAHLLPLFLCRCFDASLFLLFVGGLRVRGQRTKTTGRKGRTVGVSKKKG